jgi:hypothetical protein
MHERPVAGGELIPLGRRTLRVVEVLEGNSSIRRCW